MLELFQMHVSRILVIQKHEKFALMIQKKVTFIMMEILLTMHHKVQLVIAVNKALVVHPLLSLFLMEQTFLLVLVSVFPTQEQGQQTAVKLNSLLLATVQLYLQVVLCLLRELVKGVVQVQMQILLMDKKARTTQVTQIQMDVIYLLMDPNQMALKQVQLQIKQLLSS